MPRSVNHVASRARRKNVMKYAKGYFGRRKNVWTVAKNAVEKGMLYAYTGRKQKKRKPSRRNKRNNNNNSRSKRNKRQIRIIKNKTQNNDKQKTQQKANETNAEDKIESLEENEFQHYAEALVWLDYKFDEVTDLMFAAKQYSINAGVKKYIS